MVYNDWDSLNAGGSDGASVALEDKFEGLQRLVQLGKEKGYVLYDEVSEVLPGELPGGSELEDVLAGLDVAGIEILEEPKDFDKKLDESEEPFDLDLPAGVGEKVNDPVRMYLREMGTVPLLTREGEVEIARRIERGQNTVLKSLSRAPEPEPADEEVLDLIPTDQNIFGLQDVSADEEAATLEEEIETLSPEDMEAAIEAELGGRESQQ